ncbi:MAG: ferritin family protein [Phycisphaerae bacterium]
MGIFRTSKLPRVDWDRFGDNKALAIAAYGRSVAAYRYIVLAEKSAGELREIFERLAAQERTRRDRLQALLAQLSPEGSFCLSNEDKLIVCVGPRLVDARDDARLDEAMKLVIGSAKRTASFYARYAGVARDAVVRATFEDMAVEALAQVRRLREVFQMAGRQIAEPCPVQQIRG